MVDAAIEAFTSTGKPYLHISGQWIYGDNPATTRSRLNAPALVSWKEPIHRRVLDAKGMRGVVILSGVAYGDGGGGIPGLLLGSPRDDAGNLIMLGTGQQHWSTVHVVDLADFFRRVRGRLGPWASTSSAMERIRPSPKSPRRPPSPAHLRSPAPTTRLGRPRLLRRVLLLDQGSEPRPRASSIGVRPIRGWSTSSGMGATATEEETDEQGSEGQGGRHVRRPIEVVGKWLENLLDPDVVNRVVAPDATYVSLNTEDAELNKIMPWAGTSHGPQAFLDNSARCSAAGRTRRST